MLTIKRCDDIVFILFHNLCYKPTKTVKLSDIIFIRSYRETMFYKYKTNNIK